MDSNEDDTVRYAISAENVPIQNAKSKSWRTLLKGTLVVLITQANPGYGAIQVIDRLVNRCAEWGDTVWLCPLEFLKPIATQVFAYIQAISSPFARLNVVTNDELCSNLINVKSGVSLTVKHEGGRHEAIVECVNGNGTLDVLIKTNGGQNCREIVITVDQIDVETKSEKYSNQANQRNHVHVPMRAFKDDMKLSILPNKLLHERKIKDDKQALLSDWPRKNCTLPPAEQLRANKHERTSKINEDARYDDLTKSSRTVRDCECNCQNERNGFAERNGHAKDGNLRQHYDEYPSNGYSNGKHVSHERNITRERSVKNSSKPNYVEKKHSSLINETNEVDLMQVLRGTWPEEASGPIGTILTNDYHRNKSLNPISHMIHKRKTRNSTGEYRNTWSDAPPSNATSVSSAIYDTPEREHSPISDQHLSQTKNGYGHSQNSTRVQPIHSNASNTSHRPAQNDTRTLERYDSSDIDIGSIVQISVDSKRRSHQLYGVVRYICDEGEILGVELDSDLTSSQLSLDLDLTDGTWNGDRLFECPPNRGVFVPIEVCCKDSRFDDFHVEHHNGYSTVDKKLSGCRIDDERNGYHDDDGSFGSVDCPIVPGKVPPITAERAGDLHGKYQGIQGHNNSCYLDATLFAMFACTSVFDTLLFRPKLHSDIDQYETVQNVLRDEIVNPLRKNLYVRADRVMKLRKLLEKLSTVTGLTCEEKDPEEFLNCLLEILKAEAFLKLSSNQEAYFYQLFVEKDESLELPSVQQLFGQSIIASNIKLKEVPSCLIIQMPRFGKSFKMYPRIIPSLILDVTDVIDNSPRQCTVCGILAKHECVECFGLKKAEGLEGIAYCTDCLQRTHATEARRTLHKPVALTVPDDYEAIALDNTIPPRLYMELFAVVCIETSHYVSFVKCGSGVDAPWCFFDSMADRKGEQNGYNIPEIIACPDLTSWLDEEANRSRDTTLPEPARRLLCDAYLCLYQSSDVMMYR